LSYTFQLTNLLVISGADKNPATDSGIESEPSTDESHDLMNDLESNTLKRTQDLMANEANVDEVSALIPTFSYNEFLKLIWNGMKLITSKSYIILRLLRSNYCLYL